MPRAAEIRRGGVLRYRTIRRGGKIFTVAVVRKPGPRGGRTLAWPRKRS